MFLLWVITLLCLVINVMMRVMICLKIPVIACFVVRTYILSKIAMPFSIQLKSIEVTDIVYKKTALVTVLLNFSISQLTVSPIPYHPHLSSVNLCSQSGTIGSNFSPRYSSFFHRNYFLHFAVVGVHLPARIWGYICLSPVYGQCI